MAIETSKSEAPSDVLIIGGGPAGLSAALTLARQLHSAVVFDSGVYRNAPSKHMHMVLSWDRENPKKFREAARANIMERYTTISLENTEIDAIEKIEDHQSLFKATSKEGKVWYGRKVILATGVQDILLDIPGYKENWAKSIFHCFFCKGFEARGASSAGILAIPDVAGVPQALHFARTAKRFAETVTIYTHGDSALKQALEDEQGDNQVFKLDNRKITKFEAGKGLTEIILHFEDGETVTEGFLGHKPKTEPKGTFHKQLGLEMLPNNDPKIHPMFCQASVRGVFVAGDGASPLKLVAQAQHSGTLAAGGACAQLQAEEMNQKCMF